MEVLVCEFKDLTTEEQEDFYDDGYRKYLVITWDDGKREIYTDGMEPEDATFGRDLAWIPSLIERAYKKGLNLPGSSYDDARRWSIY